MSHSTRSRKPAGFGAIVAAALTLGVLFAPSAWAHHPEISGTASCDSSIDFTSVAWDTADGNARANGKIGIAYSADGGAYVALPDDASYHYDAANDYQFSDTFTPPTGWSSVTLRATALGAWDDGAGPGDSRTSSPIAARTDCAPVETPAAPTAAIARARCSVGGAEVTLTNTGGTAVDFTVSDGTTDQVVSVDAGDSDVITIDTPESEDVTITVTAAGMEAVTRTVAYDCTTPAAPAATVADSSCVDSGAVVHLVNTGGEDADFTITVAGQPDDVVNVDAGDTTDVTVPTPADVMTTITVSAPGMADVVSTATYTCAVASGTGQTAEEAAAEAAAAAAAAEAARAAAVAGQLPVTGSNTGQLVAIAFMAIVGGLALIIFSRTKERHVSS